MKKEPLELRDLAIYLPYGINCLVTKSSYLHLSEEERTGMLTSIEIDSNVDNICVTRPSGEYLLTDIENILPVLRPMEFFLQSIDFEGKTFIPEKKILDDCWMYRMDDEKFKKISDTAERTIELPFWIVERLISWHFDVFHFIKKSNAIPMNHLK